MATYVVERFWRGNPSAPIDSETVEADSAEEAESLCSSMEDINHYVSAREADDEEEEYYLDWLSRQPQDDDD